MGPRGLGSDESPMVRVPSGGVLQISERVETSDVQLGQLLEQLAAARAARPAWWRDAEQHDEHAANRDEASRDRDHAALARDAAATQRDGDASDREQAAVDLAARAYARLDGHDAVGAAAEVAHVRHLAELQRVFDDVRSLPGVPTTVIDALQLDVELLMDSAYVSTLAMALERDHERNDLRSIAQHLDAATRDRLVASQDRAAAAADRHAADTDRQHSLSARQRAALQRAADRY
jgi:hypothetical protein